MKIILIVIALHMLVFAKDSQSNRFYVGVDFSPVTRGEHFYGSGPYYPDPIDYNVDDAVLYKLGLIINDFLRFEYGYNTFHSKEYKDLKIHSLEAVLTFKFLSTRRLLDTTYMIYPSLEAGLAFVVFTAGINLHYEINNNIEALLSWRYIDSSIGLGGESDSISGAYIGMRYKF